MTDEFVLFWTSKDVYSNFHYTPFYYKGIRYKWAEQAIMYEKAKLFGADKIAESILEAIDAGDCKKLGRSREIPFNENIWDKNKERIFKDILREKYKLSNLRRLMLQSGKREFVEASPYDNIWGIGMRENDPGVTDRSNWKGQNLLGKILTEIRDEIQEEISSKDSK